MRSWGLSMFAGVSLLALSSPAVAQQASEGAVSDSSDIVVTARRRDESIQDVPLTVNAVSADTIAKLNLRDFKDVAAIVPGLVLNPGIRTTGGVISLRGLAIDNTTSGNNGTVQFYLNDSPISGGAVLQAMYDVGQIEVLRGPQGTLRGIASPSGSITLTTKRPVMDEFGGFVEGNANTNNGYRAQGAINAPIVKDVIALRVAGLYDKNEGSRVRSLSRPDLKPYNKTKSVRASLRITPTDTIEANASYTYMKRDFILFDQVESANLANPALPASPTLITGRQRLAVASVPVVGMQEFNIFNWQAKWSFAGQRLDYVGSTYKQFFIQTDPLDKGDFFNASYPGDASASNNNGTYSTIAATMNLQNMAQATNTESRAYSHEVRLSSEERLFGIVDYVIGGFITKQSPDTRLVSAARANFAGVVSPTTFTGFTPSPVARVGSRSIERALFGNLTVHLGEATEIAGGVRRLQYQENFNGPNNTFNTTIWNASAKHRFSDDFMVYGNAGSSFRVGSGTNALILGRNISIPGIVDPFLLSLIPITPERSKSYEIGFRSSWLDKRLTLNVSAFLQNFKGYIFPAQPYYVLNNPTGASPVPNNNANVVLGIATTAAPVPAKVKGIEAELGFRPSERFSLQATMAYAQAKMNNAVLPCNPPGVSGVPTAAAINQTGTQQVFRCVVSQSASRSSPFTASVQSEYNHPVGTDMQAFARGLVSVFGKSTNDAGNPIDDIPAYALVNLYAGVRAADGEWEVSAYARNLFNTFRVTDRTAPLASVPTNLGTLNSTYRTIFGTEPREFGIVARFAIGSR